jgi:hypothetical protein
LRLDENLFEELEIILVSPRDSREKVQSLAVSGIYLKLKNKISNVWIFSNIRNRSLCDLKSYYFILPINKFTLALQDD